MTARIAFLHGCLLLVLLAGQNSTAYADSNSAGTNPHSAQQPPSAGTFIQSDLELPNLSPANLSRQSGSNLIQIVLIITVLSLAPAIIVLLTCFTRIIVVLALARQALGTGQLPPTQILVGLAIVLTIVIMAPTWSRVNEQALQPYLTGEITSSQAVQIGQVPLRAFMIRQIETYKNQADVWMFLKYTGPKDRPGSEQVSASVSSPAPIPEQPTWADVPTRAMIPAFVISELKIAFLMGFKIYLPFLVIDMVVASILISMGMFMLPPVLVSLPFKILLFVLVNGWHLLTGSLLQSFAL